MTQPERPATKPQEKPWIIVGTGPTFQAPDPDKYRILALNRAANHCEADVIALSHKSTLEKIPRETFRDKTVIVSDPVILDPGLEPVRQYPPVASLREICKLEVFKRFDHCPISVEQLRHILPQYGTIATFAIAWLRRQGVTEFYSVGIDGGDQWHTDLVADYQDLKSAFSTNYDHALNCVGEVVRALGMTWHKIAMEGEEDETTEPS